MKRAAALVTLALLACGGTAPAARETHSDSAGSSDLPGVTLAVRAPKERFTRAEAAAGITFALDVRVAADVVGVASRPQDSGGCGQPGASGLTLFTLISGTSAADQSPQRYCLCDTGLCPGGPVPAVTLRAGEYHESFAWDGRNWGGPSDTSNPRGAPFPPGTYEVTTTAVGSWSAPSGARAFKVVGTARFEIVP